MTTETITMSMDSLLQLTHLRKDAFSVSMSLCSCPVVLQEPDDEPDTFCSHCKAFMSDDWGCKHCLPIGVKAAAEAGIRIVHMEPDDRFSVAMEGAVGSVNYSIYHLLDGERSIYTHEGEDGDPIHLIASLLNRLTDEEANKWIKEYIS